MHKQLLENPVKVLKNFYETCNVEYSFHKVINIETLRNALIELQRENFSFKFNKLNFPIHTFYSTNDKVLNINKESIDFLDNDNGGFFIGPKDGEKLIVRAVSYTHLRAHETV